MLRSKQNIWKQWQENEKLKCKGRICHLRITGGKTRQSSIIYQLISSWCSSTIALECRYLILFQTSENGSLKLNSVPSSTMKAQAFCQLRTN